MEVLEIALGSRKLFLGSIVIHFPKTEGKLNMCNWSVYETG